MKVYKKILAVFVKIAESLMMLMIAGLAGMIVFELSIRNFLNKSFRSSIEVCGIMFIWLIFLGIIYLYDKRRLMRFEILLSRANRTVLTVFWFINKAASMMLGAVMIISYVSMYPFVSTRYFSTIQFLPYSFQFLAIAVTGGFIVLKTIYELIEQLRPGGENQIEEVS